MKIAVLLALLSITYGIAAENFMWKIVKGVSEGIEDAYKKGESHLKDFHKKLEKRIVQHPKFKHHKVDLKKVIKKAGKHLEKLHKKVLKKYGPKGAKMVSEKYNKHVDAIKKWMSALTKNNTDGEMEHGIPFLPHVVLPYSEDLQEKGREKAMKIFESLAKMWEAKVASDSDESEVKETKSEGMKANLLGEDEEKIMPYFVKKGLKKGEVLLGKDEKFIEPKFVSEKLKQLHKNDLLGQDEMKIQPKFVSEKVKDWKKKEFMGLKKEIKSKKQVVGAEELAVQLLGLSDNEKKEKEKDELEMMKIVNKESEDLEKTVEELIPFLGEGKSKKEIEMKNGKVATPRHVLLSAAKHGKVGSGLKMIKENPVNAKTLDGAMGEEDNSKSDEEEEESIATKEILMQSSKKVFEEAERKIAEEQKMFEEAEKKWELEIKKKAEEEIENSNEKNKKTTEEKEVEEELKKPYDDVFTPPEGAQPTAKPITKEDFKPIFFFDFDDSKEEQIEPKNEGVPKIDKVLSLPLKVKEPVEVFMDEKDSENTFEEMRPEIKPFFQSLDDAILRNKFLKEEKQWMQLKKWASKKLFKANKKGKNSKKVY